MKKLFIIFAIICLAAPVMAAEWDFYGSARMSTFRTSNDVGLPGATADDDDTTWAQQGNSRIGAHVKLNDQIGGRFEMSDSFGKRMLYGTYNFGNSQLLLGQTYTPSTSFYSNSVYAGDGDLLGVGQFYTGRIPMIQWKWSGLKVALISPNVPTVMAAFTGTDIDVDLPKLEVAYKFKTDMFFVDVFGGYQTYTIDGALNEYDVDSYVVGLGGGVTFGPFFFNAGVHMGTNLGDYGNAAALTPDNITVADKATVALAASASYNAATDEIVDNDGMGFLAVLGFNISEMFTVEAGYGYQEYEPDVAGSVDANATQYYLNCTINIAPGFFIVPEIGKVEYEAADVDLGDAVYYGAKWQINF